MIDSTQRAARFVLPPLWLVVAVLSFIAYGVLFTTIVAVRNHQPYLLISVPALLSAAILPLAAIYASWTAIWSKWLRLAASFAALGFIAYCFIPVYFFVLSRIVEKVPPLPSSEVSVFGTNAGWSWFNLLLLIASAAAVRCLAVVIDGPSIAKHILILVGVLFLGLAAAMALSEVVRVLLGWG